MNLSNSKFARKISASDRATKKDHHLQARLYIPIIIGGAFGTSLRYEVAKVLPTLNGSFPVATLIVNLLGSFILGLLLELLATKSEDIGVSRRLRLLIGTGFCGSLTTFSTFATEVDLLIRGHDPSLAISYLLVTVIGGLGVTAVGIRVANEFIGQSAKGRRSGR